MCLDCVYTGRHDNCSNKLLLRSTVLIRVTQYYIIFTDLQNAFSITKSIITDLQKQISENYEENNSVHSIHFFVLTDPNSDIEFVRSVK